MSGRCLLARPGAQTVASATAVPCGCRAHRRRSKAAAQQVGPRFEHLLGQGRWCPSCFSSARAWPCWSPAARRCGSRGPARTASSGQLMLTTPILRPCTSRCGGLAVSGLGAARAHREGTWRIDDTRRQAHRPCHDRTRRRPGGGRPERRVVRRPVCCRCCRC